MDTRNCKKHSADYCERFDCNCVMGLNYRLIERYIACLVLLMNCRCLLLFFFAYLTLRNSIPLAIYDEQFMMLLIIAC